MEITYRLNDPVSGLILADAYMRWALEAAEEVASADEFAHILAQAGLSQFIDNYPPDNVDPPYLGVTFGAYARLNAALLTHYGLTGKSIVRRIGRITVHKAVNHQSKLFNLETVLAAKSMPSDTQIKLGLSAMVTGWRIMSERTGQEFIGDIEDGGDHWKMIIETDAVSAGLVSDQPVGWLIEGAIEESGKVLFGKFFDVTQSACRSMGAPASVWHIPKQPS